MFSHIHIATSDMPRAMAFYRPVLTTLGLKPRFAEATWAGWTGPQGGRPLFIVGLPFDRKPHAPGNGQMVAFLATSRPMVDEWYEVALANAGTCDGPPGLRPHYHPNYYGAYVRDPDGNKLCAACHDAA